MASSRNLARGGPAKNYFGIPRSLTLRLFDSNSSQSNPQPVKSDASYNATSDPRQRTAGRSNSSSQPAVPPDSSFFVHSDRQRLRNSVFDRPFKRKASGNSRGYGIYPSGSKNTFIYESSISSKSDIQSLSEHPKPEGDADSILSYGGDVSSIRARCSAETLHSTAPESVVDSSPNDSPTHSPRRIVPVNLPALIEAQNSITAGIIALSLPQEGSISDSDSDSTINGDSYGAPEPHNPDLRVYPTTPSVSRRPLPEPRPLPMVPYAPRPAANVPLPPPRRPEPPVLPQTQPRLRRDSVDRAASTQNQPMQVQAQGAAHPAHAVSTPGPARTPTDINSSHAFPPGLSSDPPISPAHETHPESRSSTAPPQPRRERRDSFSVQPRRPSDASANIPRGVSAPPVSNRPSEGPVTPGPSRAAFQDSRTVPQASSSTSSNRQYQQARGSAPPPTPSMRQRQSSFSQSGPNVGAPPPTPSMRQRQPSFSQSGPTVGVPMIRTQSSKGGSGSGSGRCVRWNENLICPSPIPPHERPKGWFNRRGDQLWTNDGNFKPPNPGEEYPRELQHYPDCGAGWMNEEGVRIDMQHRLVPKAPLRSALKRTKPSAAGHSAAAY